MGEQRKSGGRVDAATAHHRSRSAGGCVCHARGGFAGWPTRHDWVDRPLPRHGAGDHPRRRSMERAQDHRPRHRLLVIPGGDGPGYRQQRIRMRHLEIVERRNPDYGGYLSLTGIAYFAGLTTSSALSNSDDPIVRSFSKLSMVWFTSRSGCTFLNCSTRSMPLKTASMLGYTSAVEAWYFKSLPPGMSCTFSDQPRSLPC